MTNTNQTPGPAKDPVASINDNLPTTNPSLRTVMIVVGCLALVALFLTFHKSLGF